MRTPIMKPTSRNRDNEPNQLYPHGAIRRPDFSQGNGAIAARATAGACYWCLYIAAEVNAPDVEPFAGSDSLKAEFTTILLSSRREVR